MIKIYNGIDSLDSQLFIRTSVTSQVGDIVADIIENVKKNGDRAIKEYTERFDKLKLDNLELPKERLEQAKNNVSKEFLEVLTESAENIRQFHSKQLRKDFEINENGRIVGQRYTPLERVGVYVPGGKAAYPSTVLMDVIPAKIAGVKEIVMVTPANGGELSDYVLAAALVAGVDKVFTIGGAQAVAGLAYGTESIPKCDKIVGPGNAFVAEAKRQIFGDCGIDMVAGPSEILIVSDSKTPKSYVAADLLSQAEHDENASSVLVTDSLEFAKEVAEEVERQIQSLERKAIASRSINNNGKIIVCKNIDEAIDIANLWAPEHLELCLDDPFETLKKIKHAGSVFLGRFTPEAIGDYFAGANHTLPTGGSARFSSALSVDDFVKKTQYIYYDEQQTKAVADKLDLFAKVEGLTAHGRSVTIRK